jgi:hypothetical protein
MEIQHSDEIDTIGVCVVTNNNYEETKFFIDNLINKIDGKCTLYLYDYKSESKDFRNYLANVCMAISGRMCFITEQTKLPTIYNQFIVNAKDKYLAILPINAIVDYNWISELLYHYKNIVNSGCIGIRSQQDDVELSSVLFNSSVKDEDEMRTIWVKNLNVLDAPLFFEKSKIEIVGLLCEDFENNGYEMNEFSFRFTANGFLNYYIRNTSCIKTFIENPFLFSHKSKAGRVEFKRIINQIAKEKNTIE